MSGRPSATAASRPSTARAAARSVPAHIVKQRALAHPRLAAQYMNAALPRKRRADGPVQRAARLPGRSVRAICTLRALPGAAQRRGCSVAVALTTALRRSRRWASAQTGPWLSGITQILGKIDAAGGVRAGFGGAPNFGLALLGFLVRPKAAEPQSPGSDQTPASHTGRDEPCCFVFRRRPFRRLPKQAARGPYRAAAPIWPGKHSSRSARRSRQPGKEQPQPFKRVCHTRRGSPHGAAR
jgi:hypothetical protein